MKKYRMALRFAGMALLIMVFVFTKAQQADTVFSKEWKVIDSLIIKNNLTKTALEKVNALYERARQQKLPAQRLKALIYQYTLATMVTDNNPALSVSAIETEISISSDETQKAILHTLLAKKYLDYYNNERWIINLNGRSNTNLTSKDITTWGPANFVNAISSHFRLALTNEQLLKQTRLDAYNAIIIRGNTRELRPTLFDLLAHEALEYFKYGEEWNVKPVQLFTVSEPALLSPAEQFTKLNIPTKDSSSLQWQALNLYKRLIAFHLPDANKNALITLDLERLEWVHSKASFANKDQLYSNAITKLIEQYPSSTAITGAWYALATAEVNKAGRYSPFGDTTTRYSYNRAEEYARKGMSSSGDTSTAMYANLQNLLRQINQKELRTDIEKVNVPGKPFRALVNYRNTAKLHARIIRVNDESLNATRIWENGFWNKLLLTSAYRSFTQELPQTNDHQLHATEIKVDALPVGEYVLLISSGSSFLDKVDRLHAHYFHVSNISYVQAGSDYFVLNRETGQPIPNAKVTILRNRYSNTRNSNVTDTVQFKTTDNKGYFSYVPSKPEYQNVKFHFSTGTDWLSQNEPISVYYDYEPENDYNMNASLFEQRTSRVFFFMDRSLYRPGQNVFFKGIAVTKDYETKLSKIVTSKDSAWVYLKDASQKKIDSLRYALNSFGSFNGTFRLPQNTLTGGFFIEAAGYTGSIAYFSVEEYKRPTFSVSFDKVKGAYRLNDSIIVTGTAKAYAGNTISGATVKYRVSRNAFYQPYPWAKISPGTAASREITNGEIITDTAGRFTIRFKALADDIIDRSGNPLFTFSIQADITDITGETRSAANRITTSFTALQLAMNTATISEKDSSKIISVQTTNMSNEKEPAIVQLRIYPLQAPDRLIRKRYWQRPDQFVMTKDEFTRSFPTDEYENETDYINWPTGTMLLEKTVNTKDSSAWILPAGALPTGHYKIEAITKDKYGEEVKQLFFTQVFDRKSGVLPAADYRFAYTVNNTIEPGNTATFLSGTSANRIYLIRKTEWPTQKKKKYEHEIQNKGIHPITYTATENDRGGTFISEAYVIDNRVYSNQFTVAVPWSNKQLKITYDTYRSNTEPGSPEKWTVSIEGNKSDSNAAELLTAMYDASLDQFKPHNWNIPTLWATNFMRSDFNGSVSFAASYTRTERQPDIYYKPAGYLSNDRLASSGDELWYQQGNISKPGNLHSVKTFSMTFSQDMAMASAPGNRKAADLLNSIPKIEVEKLLENTLPSVPGQEPIAEIPQVRKNFNETAFFFPVLYADASGKYSFSFTIPEAVTQWKWMSFAHTKDLSMGMNSATITTQKKLMVQPNAPRFMREGDHMELSTKIVNLTDKEIKGQATLELTDPTTNTSVDGWFHNVFPVQHFSVEAGQSMAVKFPMQVPFSYNKALTWRIVARSENISDGEENTLPVLTNRMLVTETLPIFLPTDTTRSFVFDKLLNNKSESLTHESITVEYTSNPAWYAVQALPYLVDFPYECAEQTFNRFYATTLASYIINKHPRIKQVFDQWKKDTTALLSNLQKNEELKQILLQETPWVLQAESEEQKKKNLALLFDLARLSQQSDMFIKKLEEMQLPVGAFSWFKGGYADRYITNYILTGIGKLKRLGALTPDLAIRIRNILTKAIHYTDARIADDYNLLVKNKTDLSKQNVYSGQLDYLFMRSFFADIAQQSRQAYDYYFKQAKTFWTKQNSYQKAQIGLIYLRNNEKNFAANSILPALLENAVEDTKLGMYWKSAYTGFWYQVGSPGTELEFAL